MTHTALPHHHDKEQHIAAWPSPRTIARPQALANVAMSIVGSTQNTATKSLASLEARE